MINTMNEDAFDGDEGKSPDDILREVEALGQALATGDTAVAHEDRPPGYGVLLETYEWRPYPVGPGVAPQVRAYCLTDNAFMVLTLKVDPRYGKTFNKHTPGKAGVVYTGRPVQAWMCRQCGQWTIK